MRRTDVDVYLLPTVLGGGIGDVEQVLAAGRRLARAGLRVQLYRKDGRALPPGVAGPWGWPPTDRLDRLEPSDRAAMTIGSSWGVTSVPVSPGTARRPGPWSEEVAAIERAHGPDRTLHVSLEEFARTLTPRQETIERYREGGIRSRELPQRLAAARDAGELGAFEAAYRDARALDRPNVIALYTTFRRSATFARAFPEAVQAGPIWPASYGGRRSLRRHSGSWVWYASPASAERIFPSVVEGLSRAADRPRLLVRAGRPWSARALPPGITVRTRPLGRAGWQRRFSDADVRIVTGSRSLLEALEVGGPFLYFNGVLGRGAGRRRHRPEKIALLLAEARRQGWGVSLRRDLADFARGRRVAEIVRRAAERRRPWGAPFPPLVPKGFRPPFDDAGRVLVDLIRALAAPGARAAAVASELRRRSNR